MQSDGYRGSGGQGGLDGIPGGHDVVSLDDSRMCMCEMQAECMWMVIGYRGRTVDAC